MYFVRVADTVRYGKIRKGIGAPDVEEGSLFYHTPGSMT